MDQINVARWVKRPVVYAVAGDGGIIDEELRLYIEHQGPADQDDAGGRQLLGLRV